MNKMGYCLLVLALCLASVSAISTRPRSSSLTSLQSLIKQRATSESCYYSLNLANHDGNGFQGKIVTVTVGDEVVVTASLLPQVYEKSVQIPVTAGQAISLQYGDGAEALSNNSFWVTDANGASVLTVDDATTGSYVVPSVASCECVYQTEDCPAIRVRNEFRSLSYCDKTNFIDALTTFRTTPTEHYNYTTFIILHAYLSASVIERALFMPWHRALILEFENGLRSMGGRFACISLPYWDWSLDFGHEMDSPVIAELGGFSARSCLTGPFANWTDPTTRECVVRRDFITEAFYPSVACNSAMELGITANSSYWFAFTYFVRNPHKSVHIFVGGSKGTMGTLASPADPLFWLHHANIDRMYALWQDCWDFDKAGTEQAQYRDISDGLAPLDGQMPQHYPGRTTTIRSMLNMPALGYRYPPSYRSLKRLIGAQDVFEDTTSTCKWDWFDVADFKSAGLTYRPELLSVVEEQRLSESRLSYNAELEKSGNYFSAIVSQLTTECDIGNGTFSDPYPAVFIDHADHTAIIGPSELFKNACELLVDKTLADILSH